MQSYINASKVRRNGVIARILTYGGLGIMGLGLLVSFQEPVRIDLVFLMFFVGMIASQIGIPMRNRWDRRPRMDEVLDSALKGLDKRYAVFHYSLGAKHVLFSPAGVFALIPRLESGKIRYTNGTWTRTTPRKRRIFRRGGTRKIRGIERQSRTEITRASKNVEVNPLSIRALIVFVHPGAALQAEGAPSPAAHVKKLKPGLRKMTKAETLSALQVNSLAAERGLS